MYLYYDSNYTLKEIINDKAIIADSVNANKIYVMFETDQLESGYDLSYIRYRSGGNNYSMFYTEDLVTDPFAATPDDNCYVPFNKNRDLKFFKYGKAYRFRVFNIPTEVLTNSSVSATVWYVLDTDQDTRIVNGEIVNGDDDATLAMEMFAFAVNPSANKVAIDTVISLAQWSQLVILISQISGFDPTQIESAIETLQSYFTDGSAKNALKLGNKLPSYYANENDIANLQRQINELSYDFGFQVIVSKTAEETPNITSIVVGGTTIQGALVPSNDTMGKMYLCNDITGETNNSYSEYISTREIQSQSSESKTIEVTKNDDNVTVTYSEVPTTETVTRNVEASDNNVTVVEDTVNDEYTVTITYNALNITEVTSCDIPYESLTNTNHAIIVVFTSQEYDDFIRDGATIVFVVEETETIYQVAISTNDVITSLTNCSISYETFTYSGKTIYITMVEQEYFDNFEHNGAEVQYTHLVTVYSYAWELIGTTSVTLSGYAKLATWSNLAIPTSAWASDSTYSSEGYNYKITIGGLTGVTSLKYAEVIFSIEQANSGNYAPICETGSGVVYIWAKINPNEIITIPTVKVEWSE